ncbi:hypothetical protein KS4_22750 [Poriferisphaera corsica]|uniref:Uncharacterized protein n=1 Tax=Poriferisphaera corsica TaxID=2528020 RepID=A0A517YVF6_9BACT|nr:ABC transporter permease [Poriferisphaera corsica]QDU34210.1 hypothetical protein KS4_22750 [Poriferisphaera corsica]
MTQEMQQTAEAGVEQEVVLDEAEKQEERKASRPLRAQTLLAGAVVMLVITLLIVAFISAVVLDGRYGMDRVVAVYTPGSMVFIYTAMLLPALLTGVIGVALLIMGSLRAGIWGNEAKRMAEMQTEMMQRLDEMNDRLLLSETAKKIAYRWHDVDALRKSIREDINAKRFDAALALIGEMSESYGHVEESENFRDEIHAARRAEMESKITVAITQIEKVLDENDYEKAMQDARRLMRLYPESERAKAMPERVADARDDYKNQVEREFLVAAGKDDVNRAMDLLKVLDVYLTPSEAEPLREVARGVIGKLRDNLGVQFKMAVHDGEWRAAVKVGGQLVEEFPNTRMAAEVRGLMDELKKRVGEMETQGAY